MKTVEKNNKVKVHYTGKLEDGSVFDSSVNREPLEYTAGAGQMIPGFDNGVLGMQVAEKKTLTIPAADAYGEKNDDMVQELPKTVLGPGVEPEVGMQLVADNGMQVTVVDVAQETIKIDANHPLAGKTLIFDVEVVEIAE